MNVYALAYRLGLTPWERYVRASARSIGALLDREVSSREGSPSGSESLGRALDLGCGRGLYTAELARRGWDVTGLDNVPRAIEAARRRGIPGAAFVVGDVTRLGSAGLGEFDFFLDVGCFQGLGPDGQRAEAVGVSALARTGATLLLMAFQPKPGLAWSGAVSRADVERAFGGWELLSVEAAATTGLGWPLSRTSPQWYRLRWPS